MSECRFIEMGEVARMLRASQPDEVIMVFPPGELEFAKMVGAEGHAVAVVPKDLWDRIPVVQPGNRVVITDCGHLLGLLDAALAQPRLVCRHSPIFDGSLYLCDMCNGPLQSERIWVLHGWALCQDCKAENDSINGRVEKEQK